MRFVSLLLLIPAAGAVISCPTLPPGCSCEALDDSLDVVCRGVNSTDLLWKAVEGRPVDQLVIRNCSLLVLQPLPQLTIRSLEIAYCNISKVSETAFANVADSLESLDLEGNSLVTMPLFGSLPKLNTLNLHGNQLTDVAENAFEGSTLPALRRLRISHNRICTLSTNSLNETKATLEMLDMSGNCLQSIPAQQLRNMVKLVYLDLSDNRIAEVANFQLMNLPVLREFRLNNNLLNKITPMAFMNVPLLRFLYMRNNLIANLDGARLQGFKQLEILDVTNNLLVKLPSFKELTTLKQVLLDGNLITKIETLAFTNNPKLQLISIQNNNIGQISRNSFDSLDQLVILLLSNNSIRALERGVLDGMKNLQQLMLRNNSLSEITDVTFSALKELTVVDVAYNQLNRISKGAFTQKPKLFWVDLSENRLATVEEGSFDSKVSNILLQGNELECDAKLDWFVEYLVVNRVRTFLPYQSEILCAGPGPMKGVRFKEVMMKKANETQSLTASASQDANPARALLQNLFPGFSIPAMQPQPYGIPSQGNSASQGAAIQQFGQQPSVPVANGNSLQNLQQLPSMMVNLPIYGMVDISKLLAHVLKGGEIPGIPKETLAGVAREYMARVQQAAAVANNQVPRHSPNMKPQLITASNVGDQLPSAQGTATLQVPTFNMNNMGTMNPQSMEILKILPPGYDISRIPAEVVTAVAQGRLPDLAVLPKDLQEYLKAHSDLLISVFSKQSSNMTIEEILAKLPKFDRPDLPTFSPYDINMLNNQLVHEEEEERRSARIKVYTAVALGLIGAVTVVVLALLGVYMRRHRRRLQQDTLVDLQRGTQMSPKESPPLRPLPQSSSQIRFRV